MCLDESAVDEAADNAESKGATKEQIEQVFKDKFLSAKVLF